MTRRQEIWREYERAWLRKHAMAKRLERIFKNDDEPDTDDEDDADADIARMTKNERTADMTFPIHKVAKSIADTGTSWLTETELTEKIFEHAQRDLRDGETPEQALARHFTAADEQGRTLRKAVQCARTGSFHPFPR